MPIHIPVAADSSMFHNLKGLTIWSKERPIILLKLHSSCGKLKNATASATDKILFILPIGFNWS